VLMLRKVLRDFPDEKLQLLGGLVGDLMAVRDHDSQVRAVMRSEASRGTFSAHESMARGLAGHLARVRLEDWERVQDSVCECTALAEWRSWTQTMKLLQGSQPQQCPPGLRCYPETQCWGKAQVGALPSPSKHPGKGGLVSSLRSCSWGWWVDKLPPSGTALHRTGVGKRDEACNLAMHPGEL